MPLPATRAELLERLRAARAKLDAECEGLSATDARRAELEGEVSVCDLLAYQIGWGRRLLAWEEAERAGETPEMPAPGFGWKELGELARSFHREHRRRSLAWLRAEFTRTVEAIERFIESVDDAELFEPGARAWAGERWPLVKWIQVNTIAPYGSARTKIRRWKRGRG